MKGRWIYLVVIVVGALLLSNTWLTQYNNRIIQQNKKRLQEIAVVESYYDQIGKMVIQALDIGLRGYAIVGEERFAAPMNNAVVWKDSILSHVQIPLQAMNYDLNEFYVFRDSLDSYVMYCMYLKQLLKSGQKEEFVKRFRLDIGRNVYGQYIQGEKNIHVFLTKLNQEAEDKYQAALVRNYQVQIILFVTCFPMLFYAAFVTRKSFKLSEKLHHFEQDKNLSLTKQNLDLELLVAERTSEIAMQNKTLATQRDELSIQNINYREAQKTIEDQNLKIISKNHELQVEIDRQTAQLREVNHELVEQNARLEQFAFVAAHDLRSPVARMLGLSNLVRMAETTTDKDFAIEKIIYAAQEMDQVIKDLSKILDAKHYVGEHVEVDLDRMLARVRNLLESEIDSTGTIITTEFSAVSSIYTSVPFLQSILYNLLHNAIKYRSFDRKPVLSLRTRKDADYVVLSISDNGIGIDLAKHGKHIFSLHKRFHDHVEGKGIGLFLVKSQIYSIGGKIEVESEVNVGTTFYIYLKIK